MAETPGATAEGGHLFKVMVGVHCRDGRQLCVLKFVRAGGRLML